MTHPLYFRAKYESTKPWKDWNSLHRIPPNPPITPLAKQVLRNEEARRKNSKKRVVGFTRTTWEGR